MVWKVTGGTVLPLGLAAGVGDESVRIEPAEQAVSMMQSMAASTAASQPRYHSAPRIAPNSPMGHRIIIPKDAFETGSGFFSPMM